MTKVDALIDRRMDDIRISTGLPVVFGGPVRADGVLLSASAGMRTRSLTGLLVAPEQGLGGHAVRVRRPVSVRDYPASQTISHAYDQQVEVEGLASMVAVPVMAGTHVRAVLYGALRRPGRVGDAAVDGLVSAASDLGRRMRATEIEHPRSNDGLAAIITSLRDLTASIDDPRLRTDILDSYQRFRELSRTAVAERPLSSRQIAILTLVATGASNAEIAATVGGSPDAIKSALRQTMRSLGARTRHAALSSARAQGLLR